MSLISRRTFCLMVFGPTLLAAVLVTFLPTSTNAKIAADDGILKLTQGNFETQFPRKLFFTFLLLKLWSIFCYYSDNSSIKGQFFMFVLAWLLDFTADDIHHQIYIDFLVHTAHYSLKISYFPVLNNRPKVFWES